MVRYYNPTRGPVSFTLRDGATVVIRPKTYSEPIASEQEGSSSLAQLRRKGLVIRQEARPRGESVLETPAKVCVVAEFAVAAVADRADIALSGVNAVESSASNVYLGQEEASLTESTSEEEAASKGGASRRKPRRKR